MAKLRKDVIARLNDAWLGVDVANEAFVKPLDMLRMGENLDNAEEFYKRLMWLIGNTDYLAFFCKHILNVELLPFQVLILQEMWVRRFPMLIVSRGGSKATGLDERLRTKDGWITMRDIKVGDRVYGGDGKLTTVTLKTEIQKDLNFYRVTLRDGRTAEICEDHLWRVWDKNNNRDRSGEKFSVISTKEMFSNYKLDRKDSKSPVPKRCTEYRFALPNSKCLEHETKKKYRIHPYVMGVLLGDGCLTSNKISFHTLDIEMVNRVNKLLPVGYIARSCLSHPYEYRIVLKDRKSGHAPFWKICADVGIHLIKSTNKHIPEEYKFGNKKQRLELIKGLMDTDGCSDNTHINYYTTSDQLAEDFMDVVRSLGISCKRAVREAWLNGVRHNDCNTVAIYTDQKIFSLPRKLKYLDHQKSKQGQSKYSKSFIVDIEYIGKRDGACIKVDNSESTYLLHNYMVTHNSFLLALYAVLRAVMMPGRKIVAVGAAFRQSKFIHDYMENFWKRAPILRSMCDESSGPKRDVDMCRMHIGPSVVYTIPVGDGCLSLDTMVTSSTCFNTISQCDGFVWGNGLFRYIDYNIDNGIKPTKIVRTRKGYNYEGTYNHAMKVLRDGVVDWVRTDDMKIGDRILVDRSVRWHNGDFECSMDEAYALGAFIGDGSWTRSGLLRYTTEDQYMIDRVNAAFGGKFKQCTDKVHWNYYCEYAYNDWINFWGLKPNCYTKDKTLPPNILRAPRDLMSECIRGLMDADGHCFVNTSKGGTTISVNLTNTSKKLVEQVQYILLHYGIISRVSSRDRDEKWERVYELGIYGLNVKKFAEQINFGLPRKRKQLDDAIASRKKWNSFDDDIPVPVDKILSSLEGKSKPHKFGNSHIKERKSFQQTFLREVLKVTGETEWSHLVNEDIFYDVVESIDDSECHTCDIHVPDGNEYCGNGLFSHNSKIRGLRSQDILSDEFACLRSNSLIQTDLGVVEIADYLNGTAYSLLNADGEFEYPDTIFRTPMVDVYRISTMYGYHIECSEIHQVMTQDGWKKTLDLTTKDYVRLGKNDYFPPNSISAGDLVLDERIGWLMGILISEGCVTSRNSFSIKNTDKKLIDYIQEKFDYKWTVSHKDARVNSRGWNCKESWDLACSDTKLRTNLLSLGLGYDIAINKKFPKGILKSPRNVVLAFLSGMYEGDGTAFFLDLPSGEKELQTVLYSSSNELLKVTQNILLKFGILSSINARNTKLSSNKAYRLVTRGSNAISLYNLLDVIKWDLDLSKVRSKDERKPQIRKNGEIYVVSTTVCNKNKHIGTFDTEAECVVAFEKYRADNTDFLKIKSIEKLPFQEVLYDFHMPKSHSFVGNGFIQHNSHSREIFETVIAGFASVSASPAENVKLAAARDLAEKLGIDLSESVDYEQKGVGNQIILSGTCDYAFGHFAEYWRRWKSIIHSKGDKKKLREIFNGEIPDGFNWKDYSVIRIPYTLIPKGFMDDSQLARAKATVNSAVFLGEYGACQNFSAPIITDSGVKKIVDVRVGDLVWTHKARWMPVTKLTHRHYSGRAFDCGDYIVTPEHPYWNGTAFIPVEDLVDTTWLATKDGPKEFPLVKSEVFYDGMVYNLEVAEDHSYSLPTATVHNCFPRDSMGFFKRSLIESCVGTEVKPIELNGQSIYFDPMLRGNSQKQYVMGLDPASEYDNFSVAVLEVNPDHQKLVYCWTTNAKLHGERLKRGLTVEQDYYRFCVRKIRDLMALFPTVHLALDSQGGGVAIREALRDPAAILPGELPIWPIIDPKKEADTDFHSGLHILELCHFGNAEWLTEANHALRMDMETKSLIFPRFDPITIGLSIEQDKIYGRGSADMDSDFLYDTLEDAVMEVEELKNELAIIELTRTNNGRDHWDVPEVKVGVGKKQRLKKDRYSALLMANMCARQITRTLNFEMKCEAIGGFAVGGKAGKQEKCGYAGPSWWKDAIGGVYD